MGKTRLESFSDGVLAIIITIMVLDLRPPGGETLGSLRPMVPAFLSYVLSFVYLGIYWNNHHHMLQTLRQVTGRILWANLHLLFWLSLFPLATAWIGRTGFAAQPTAAYGAVMLMAALAYWLLQRAIIFSQGPDSLLKAAVGSDWKGMLSPALYLIAVLASFRAPMVSSSLYVLVALIWIIPDRRIERVLAGGASGS